jgi:iron-sulfur cluster repair protein YtfE (RIC family)
MPTSVGTKLLNEDGEASIATFLMMSHHGLRRDIAEFVLALERFGSAKGVLPDSSALREEWTRFRDTLHGHHESEDQRLFPHLSTERADLKAAFEALGADHRQIDPLLERGDRAFATLSSEPQHVDEARAVVTEISALLGSHLATEEAVVAPILRSAKGFPPPATDAEADLYAQGFAWSSYGVSPEVLARVDAILPESLTARLPRARAAFAERYVRVWGSPREGASSTSVPDWLTNS